MRVDRMPTSSTQPDLSPKRQKSPTRTGWSVASEKPPKRLRDRLLGRERHRDAADAEPGQDAGHVEADLLQNHDAPEPSDGRAREPFAQERESDRRAPVLALSRSRVRDHRASVSVMKRPGDQEDQEDLADPEQHVPGRDGQTQHEQGQQQEDPQRAARARSASAPCP